MKSIQTLFLTLCTCAAMPLIFSSCGGPHTITGKILGLDDGALYIQYAPVNKGDVQPVMDTVMAANGKFTYDITDSLDMMVYITFSTDTRRLASGAPYSSRANKVMLYVKPGDQIRLSGDATNPLYMSYDVKGEGFNHDYALLREATKEYEMKIDSLSLIADAVMNSNSDDPRRDSIGEALWSEIKPWYKKCDEVEANCITNFPGTDLAAFLVLRQNLKKFGESYPTLGEAAKNGLFAKQLAEQQSRYESHQKREQAKASIVPGAIAPPFMLTDLNGKEVTLSSFKGKYVVLDFWGTWCGWCIKGVPEMKKYYDKYRRKVEFIGIDSGDSVEDWQKAVKKHDMNWVQLRNFDDDPNLDVTMMYGVSGYPTKIIIDRQGKIVEVFVGESPEFYKKLDQLLR